MKKLSLLILLTAVVNAGAAAVQDITSHTNVGALGIKIGVPEFQPVSNDAKTVALTATFNKVLWDDLDYSGGLTLVSRSLYPLGKFSGTGDIKPADWITPAVDTQFVAFGNIRTSGGTMFVEARLWDMKNNQNHEAYGQLLKSEDTDEGARLIAHNFADAVVNLLGGGAKGIARTQIAYISERTLGVKELYLMDYDGNGSQALTSYKSIVITPAWSPDGEKIAFTSYRRNAPDIEILSRTDRRPYTFERPGGSTFTPAWSPDGSKIAFASSREGANTEIYVADWNGKNIRRLTVSKSWNNSPVWNPRTGLQIAFTSDRGGPQQIYVMNVDGTGLQRLMDEGGHADEPAWSSDGQRVAFTWQRSKTSNFDIWIHEFATGKNVQITHDAGNNERPSWAPDGRHIVFESSRTGTRQIFSMLLDGTRVRQLTNTGKNTAPAWSGYLTK
jgi:TolB protein